MPFMRTKSQLQDYIQGNNFLSDNQLYHIKDNLDIEPYDDDRTGSFLKAKLDSFKQVNQYVSHQNRLIRPGEAMNASNDKNLEFSLNELKTLDSLCGRLSQPDTLFARARQLAFAGAYQS